MVCGHAIVVLGPFRKAMAMHQRVMEVLGKSKTCHACLFKRPPSYFWFRHRPHGYDMARTFKTPVYTVQLRGAFGNSSMGLVRLEGRLRYSEPPNRRGYMFPFSRIIVPKAICGMNVATRVLTQEVIVRTLWVTEINLKMIVVII